MAKVEVLCERQAWRKLRYWVQATRLEVSGLGLVGVEHKDDEVALIIKEVFILKQKCTGSTTELDNGAVAELMARLQGESRLGQLRLWWHSHADQPVFWSGQDATTRRAFASEWVLSVVLNRKLEAKAALDVYKPFPLSMDTLAVSLVEDPDDGLKAVCEREVQELVTGYALPTQGQFQLPGSQWQGWQNTAAATGIEEVTGQLSLLPGGAHLRPRAEYRPTRKEGLSPLTLNIRAQVLYAVTSPGGSLVRTGSGFIVYCREASPNLARPQGVQFVKVTNNDTQPLRWDEVAWPFYTIRGPLRPTPFSWRGLPVLEVSNSYYTAVQDDQGQPVKDTYLLIPPAHLAREVHASPVAGVTGGSSPAGAASPPGPAIADPWDQKKESQESTDGA